MWIPPLIRGWGWKAPGEPNGLSALKTLHMLVGLTFTRKHLLAQAAGKGAGAAEPAILGGSFSRELHLVGGWGTRGVCS